MSEKGRTMKRDYSSLITAALVIAALAVAPAVAQVENHKKIKFPKLPEFKIAKPEVYDLDNGMKIFLLEDHELPLINVTARIRTGSNYEPAEKVSLGDIFGQVQREGGTGSMTGDEMDDFLEARAAYIETGVGGDVASASMNCLKDDFNGVFGVFNDVLRDPVFEEDKIDLAKVQISTGIARRNDQISEITGREFNLLVRGDESPLGRINEYATVAAVTREDLLAWHEKYYHPNNIYLGVVGDFDYAAMKQAIQETFGDWEKGPAFDEPEVAYRKNFESGVYFVEKEDTTQAYVRVGHLGIETKNPDFFAVQVLNEVLSGGFTSRLFDNVRSKKGLAYSVWGGVGSSFMRPGIFMAGLSTKSESMAESVDALNEELVGIIENPPSAEEVERAKESILNSFVFNYQSRSQILGQQMLYAYYGLPSDFLDRYRDNIEKVTTEATARVAKKYIDPDNMVLLVVGKSADFDKPVSTFGDVTEIDISIPPPPDTTPKVEKTAAALGAGSAMFAKAASTIAGEDPTPVKSAEASYSISLSMGGQALALKQKVSYVVPDRILVVVGTPMGEQKVIINGERGVMSMGGRQQDLPGEMISQRQEQLGRDLLVLASNVNSDELESVAAGSDEVDGNSCELVAVTYQGTESRLCVGDDGKVLKQTYRGKHPMQGIPGTLEIYYSDYREVDGRQLPFKQVMNFDGQELAVTTVEEISVDPELSDDLFTLPPGQ
jgi:predicted Zn-dependent peptidase